MAQAPRWYLTRPRSCALRPRLTPGVFFFSSTFFPSYGSGGIIVWTCECALDGALVAIYRLLNEAAFGPEDIRRMGAAYEAALQLLQLKDRNDPVTELVAAKIIQIFRLGEIDPPRICARALKELGVPIPE